MSKFAYHQYLREVVEEDIRFLVERDKTYGGSWKDSGGRSAWFMLVRKMDRLKQMMKRPPKPKGFDLNDILVIAEILDGKVLPKNLDEFKRGLQHLADSYVAEDVFTKVEEEIGEKFGKVADGTVLAEIRDLRRYLTLIESELAAKGTVFYRLSDQHKPGTPEDGGHHSKQEED